MRKRLFNLAFIFVLLLICSSVFAQTPQISSGLTWLYSAQTSSGNWAPVLASDYYSTASSLDAISVLDPSNSAYIAGFQWLSTQIVSPTDYLSRQIIALSHAGQNASNDIASLLLYRNADGGFASADGYPNNDILDTTFALQALKAASYSDTTLIGQSLNYLSTNQNADGGCISISGSDQSKHLKYEHKAEKKAF